MKYSIIVPVYNGEKTLEECLSALLKQTVSPTEYEVIVVDDGSTDATPDVAVRYPVTLVSRGRAGPAGARNHGARLALGEIILFLDCDCIPSQDWLENMVTPFSDPAVTAVMGRYKTRQRSTLARFVQMDLEERYRRWQDLAPIDTVFTYAAAFRRRTFLVEGGFDESFWEASNEDTELSFRLAAQDYRMVFASKAVVYHYHPEGLSSFFRMKYKRAYWRTIVYRKYLRRAVKDSFTPQVIKVQILLTYPMLGLIPFAPFSQVALLPWCGLIVLHSLTALPFVLRNWSGDRSAALLTPFYLLVRNTAFAFGIFYGVLGRRTSRL